MKARTQEKEGKKMKKKNPVLIDERKDSAGGTSTQTNKIASHCAAASLEGFEHFSIVEPLPARAAPALSCA